MLCKKFKKLAMEIINYKVKEIIPLTDEEKELDELNVRDHCHYTGIKKYITKRRTMF